MGKIFENHGKNHGNIIENHCNLEDPPGNGCLFLRKSSIKGVFFLPASHDCFFTQGNHRNGGWTKWMVQKSSWMKLGNRGFFPGSCTFHADTTNNSSQASSMEGLHFWICIHISVHTHIYIYIHTYDYDWLRLCVCVLKEVTTMRT